MPMLSVFSPLPGTSRRFSAMSTTLGEARPEGSEDFGGGSGGDASVEVVDQQNDCLALTIGAGSGWSSSPVQARPQSRR